MRNSLDNKIREFESIVNSFDQLSKASKSILKERYRQGLQCAIAIGYLERNSYEQNK